MKLYASQNYNHCLVLQNIRAVEIRHPGDTDSGFDEDVDTLVVHYTDGSEIVLLNTDEDDEKEAMLREYDAIVGALNEVSTMDPLTPYR